MAAKKPVQRDIMSMFSKPVAKEVATADTNTNPFRAPISTDPEVRAFYNTLSPNEVIAHSIAVTKLGTSYDVTRTHGFLKWKSTRK